MTTAKETANQLLRLRRAADDLYKAWEQVPRDAKEHRAIAWENYTEAEGAYFCALQDSRRKLTK